MPMKLEEIEPGEISLVDVPANKRKFLFKKADLEGSSKTVPNGILVCPQCDHQEALIDFVKSASELCPECGADLLNSDTKIIFKRRRNMKLNLKELIEKLFEDDEGEEELTEEELEQIEKAEKQIPKDALNAVKGALNLLTKYKSVLPDDVQAAIKTLAKVAAYGYGYPAKKKGDDEDEEDEDQLKKAGAKLSKDTIVKLKKIFTLLEKTPEAVKLLKELIPTESKKGDTEVLVETLGGKLDEILKALKGQASEEEEDDEKKGDLKKELEKVQKTLKKIAETKGFSKLLKGIGEEEEEEEEEAEEEEEEEEEKGTKQKTKKKAAYKWPFTLTPPQKKKD